MIGLYTKGGGCCTKTGQEEELLASVKEKYKKVVEIDMNDL